VRVEVQAVELNDGTRLVTAPKTDAGTRRVYLPAVVTQALREHLNEYGTGPAGLLFTGPLSDGLRRATFYKEWNLARKAVGYPHLHLHDLRHAAGTLAAQTGATLNESWPVWGMLHRPLLSATSTPPSAGTGSSPRRLMSYWTPPNSHEKPRMLPDRGMNAGWNPNWTRLQECPFTQKWVLTRTFLRASHENRTAKSQRVVYEGVSWGGSPNDDSHRVSLKKQF
jgi:hypothetical protein